jgi:hypothetical protein
LSDVGVGCIKYRYYKYYSLLDPAARDAHCLSKSSIRITTIFEKDSDSFTITKKTR